MKTGLKKLVEETGADELIVITDTYEHTDRLQSFERLSAIAKIIEVLPRFP